MVVEYPVNVASYEQAEQIRNAVLNVEATGGQVLDVNNKKYKAVVSENYLASNAHLEPLTGNNIAISKDYIYSITSTAIRVYDKKTLKQVANVERSTTQISYMANVTGELFGSEKFAETDTHIFLMVVNSAYNATQVETIDKRTWTTYGTVSSRSTTFPTTSDVRVGIINNHLYFISNNGGSSYVAKAKIETYINQPSSVSATTINTLLVHETHRYNQDIIQASDGLGYLLSGTNVSNPILIKFDPTTDTRIAHVVLPAVASGGTGRLGEFEGYIWIIFQNNGKYFVVDKTTLSVVLEGFMSKSPQHVDFEEGYSLTDASGGYIKGMISLEKTYFKTPKVDNVPRSYIYDLKPVMMEDFSVYLSGTVFKADGKLYSQVYSRNLFQIIETNKIVGYEEVST